MHRKKGFQLPINLLVVMIMIAILVGFLIVFGANLIGEGETWIGSVMQFLGNLL